ncbi:DUF294 nucleotidyltransferase-like domain-containing protein [Methylonatrum kenyense]|uniref:putative nucleotidyltransferase substrate binding domain-containing protein n=1 Tax=Methylonatrum kenyense TaxID=455253 RepID=UPI0020BE6740|nr:putative nucleotidyltransferase substrate binding domain-containing protein [Methylonatrum kenyense]MCK8515935.1 DUF294 nucleotidyltransferase-like domain-containing protein [Methylonatrum kenyense]
MYSAEAETAPADFQHLPEDSLNALLAAASRTELEPGERIEQDPANDELLILWRGAVELYAADGGRTRSGPGLVLGLDRYLEQDSGYYGAAIALRPGVMLRLPFERIRALESDHPEIAGTLNRIISGRIRAHSLQNDSGPRGALAQTVARVMNAPLASCTAEWTLIEAFQAMHERKIGSLGVLDEDGHLQGVVTLASLARATLVDGASTDASVAVACQEAETVTPETPLWRAEAVQKRRRVKYLVVVDEQRPVGMLSQTNILQALLAQQNALLEDITACDSPAALRRIYDDVATFARDAWLRNRDANRAVLLLSDFHLAIQRRCAELTLQELRDEDLGEAPRAYALIIMGSGGRREMLLNPDQDNGIILDDEDGNLSAEERRWFEVFTDRFNRNLDTAGYILCPGDIMARNPAYQKTLGDWCRQIDQVARHPNEKVARWANIMLDFDLLYGDARLYSRLWSHILKTLAKRPRLLGFMTADDAEGSPAIGLFRRLLTTDDDKTGSRVDVKRQGLRLIDNAARIFAVSAGISDTNTLERLRGLVRQGVLDADFVDTVIAAQAELMDLLLDHQIRQAEAGEEPDKKIRTDSLDPLALESLRMSMHAVKRFQNALQARFGL